MLVLFLLMSTLHLGAHHGLTRGQWRCLDDTTGPQAKPGEEEGLEKCPLTSSTFPSSGLNEVTLTFREESGWSFLSVHHP